MRYFTAETSSVILSRLLVFSPKAAAARVLRVSIPTLDRWLENRRVPARERARFESAFEALIRQLQRREKRLVAPNAFTDAIGILRGRIDFDAENDDIQDAAPFIRELKQLLPCDVRVVMRCARRYKIQRSRVYRIADKLGVRKRVLGTGRNMTSKWRLP